MEYEYVPDDQDPLSFVALAELTTVFERYVDIDLVGSEFAPDIVSNVNKCRSVVLSILGSSSPSSLYSNGFISAAYNGAFDASLVRLSDTKIRLTITQQSSLQLPASATETIAVEELPFDALAVPGQIERSGQTAVDIRSPTVQFSGDFFSDLSSPSAYFSEDAFTDFAIRASSYEVISALSFM